QPLGVARRPGAAQASRVRAIAIWAVLICGVARARAPVAAPDHGPRLGDEAAPVSYDLTLELDPDRADFSGHVVIAIDVAAPTQILWLHAVELEITRATVGDAPVAVVDGPAGTGLRGFRLRSAATGRVSLAIDYTGHVRDMSSASGKAEEGLFRERAGGRWYLYSQAESVFARKIVPCFDEPRWKPSWRLTVIVPRGQVALANAPEAGARALPGGRRQLRFAEAARLPSYLFAVAVGPFALIDAGRVGRNHLPVRLAVQPADARKVGAVAGELARIVDALEAYVDAPLPLAKLDLVAVPRFFGAMENPGLVTFARPVLVGGRDRVMIVAHELAHQWFGDAVTPRWWEDLWLSEGFATWLGQRIASELGAGWPVLDQHDARAAALAEDDRLAARPIVHPVETSDEVEPMFDALGYEKASAVLGSFAQLAGRDVFRAAIRAYVAANTGRTVTSQAFLDAFAAATRPELAAALAADLRHAGTPAVELALRCTGAPALVASAREGLAVPVCVRFPARPGARDRTRMCVLAGAHTEQALPAGAGCPAWLAGNDGGQGYYRVIARAPAAPIAELSAAERLARGDDDALALVHGDLGLPAALAELAALARTHDRHAELAALTLARAIDGLLADPDRPAWTAWLAAQFGHRLTAEALADPARPVGAAVRDAIVELARGAVPAEALRRAGVALARHALADLSLILWVDTSDADELYRRVVKAAGEARQADEQRAVLESLGAFPGRYAPRLVDALLGKQLAAGPVWIALAAMLGRGEARMAAWRAIHDRLAPILRALAPAELPGAIAALGALCDAGARAQLAAELPPLLAPGSASAAPLREALAAIDRCVTRRAALGDVAQALAAASTPRR
ncbi:MAG TPA: M1 family metallopeptidase, partial [Kofleriaceae bacterium]